MFHRLMNDERGFTLVELLVTISILAVLFGIVTLTLSDVGSDAETTVNNAEAGVVQSAMDIYIADNSASVPATPSAPRKIDSTDAFSDYLRLGADGESQCLYGWDANGNVTQDSCP